jgi:hypothetical protein
LSFARNIGGEELGQETTMTKVDIAAFIGALVEWYDYFLYGLAASVVFTQLCFPSENPLVGTLAAFATFGVGFFFRCRTARLGRQLLAGRPLRDGGGPHQLRLGLPCHRIFREDLTEELTRERAEQTGWADQTT